MNFAHALVRPPASTFADGLTTAGLGPPDLPLALAQHEAYVTALEGCGLSVTRLPADDRFPDSTFVEDTAIVTASGAILTRPGAPSRAGEAASIASVAPMLEASDTTTVPHTSPKLAPPASVKIVAPGSDSAVTATYTAKNTSDTSTGFSLNSASKEAWLSLINARLK